MNFFTHADLIRLRTQLRHSERLYQLHDGLAARREECDNLIKQLTQEIETLRLLKPEKDPPSDKLKQLQHIKRQRQEIDLLLDESEEITPEYIFNLQETLLEGIWFVFPHSQHERKQAWMELKELLDLERQLQQIRDWLKELEERLELALQQRKKIKGKGFLSYIFGISPNVVIEKQLIGCYQLIQHALPFLQKTIKHHASYMPDPTYLTGVVTFFESLKGPCQAPWSFRHLDTIFMMAYQEALAKQKQLNQNIAKLHKREQEIKTQVNKWIEEV